jgi:hypothetical protein
LKKNSHLFFLFFFGAHPDRSPLCPVNVNARGVVSRSLVDGRLSLSSFQAIPDAQHQFVSRYSLNRTHVDAYITGMHVSQEGDNMLYYTTQLGIYAYNTKTAGTL